MIVATTRIEAPTPLEQGMTCLLAALCLEFEGMAAMLVTAQGQVVVHATTPMDFPLREQASLFCQLAGQVPEHLLVEDTLLAPALAAVCAAQTPPIRFFAASHLKDADDACLGWLFLVHVKPVTLTAAQRLSLQAMAEAASRWLMMVQQNLALAASNARWKFALDGAGHGVWDWDLTSNRVTFSPQWKTMLGYDDADIGDDCQEWVSRVHPVDLAHFQSQIDAVKSGQAQSLICEYRLLTKSGEWCWILSKGMIMAGNDHEGPRMIGTNTDITARKQSERLIWQQANFDALTGLPNKHLLNQLLSERIHGDHGADNMVALMIVDLDNFKDVNDALGHIYGDMLLMEAASRIQAAVLPADIVAREGGDEFIIVTTAASVAELENTATNVLKVLGQSYELLSEVVFCAASIGIALYPQHTLSPNVLMKYADQALYLAKSTARGQYAFYSHELEEEALKRSKLTTELRFAVEEQAFEVFYQPIFRLDTRETVKAEALVRWKHPERGYVSPAEFIPLAESTGLINAIGDWVFKEAAVFAKALRASYAPDFQISVNKSPIQFLTVGKLDWSAFLTNLDLPGKAISVEITEGLLLQQSQDVHARIKKIRDSGMSISLDDFGTGYSSLSYLSSYEIDYLKIDRSFIINLTTSKKNQALCKAIITMAHELGYQVIAEGIETEQQLHLLADMGCDMGQGYFISRPLPQQDFVAWLADSLSTLQLAEATG
ncbi:MAG TPA: EAL domain-containing protein [Methylovorus sp.]|nr:EAL domain-containing protein [Methylovorus sp.]